jgi:hypothetical protein
MNKPFKVYRSAKRDFIFEVEKRNALVGEFATKAEAVAYADTRREEETDVRFGYEVAEASRPAGLAGRLRAR